MNIPQVLLNRPAPGTPINLSHWSARGLVGCWLFNDQSGRQAWDSSPYGNHGTLHGFNDPSSKDRSSLGLQFDGSGDYVNCGNDASLNATDGDFTLGAWINTAIKDVTQVIIGKRESGNYWLFRFDADNKLQIILDDGGGIIIKEDTADIANDGNWHYVIVSRTGSLITFYIDTVSDGGGTSGKDCTNTNNLKIGIYGVIFPFNGIISTVMSWNRALTASEIKLLYQEPYDMFRI